MRTIGKRHRRRTPGGDFLSQCFECRAPTLRSDLTRRADGNLYHRRGDCGPTKLGIELDRGNAEKSRQRRRYPTPEGAITLDGPTLDPVEFDPLLIPPITGWCWLKVSAPLVSGGFNVEQIGGNLRGRTQSAGSSNYIIEGEPFETAQVFLFDPQDANLSASRYYGASRLGPTSALVSGRSHLGGPDWLQGPTLLAGGFVTIFCSATGGGRGVLTEVGWAWVNGSTGEKIAGDDWVSSVRTGTGAYTITLTQGRTYVLAPVTQYSSTDITAITAAFVWGGRVSSTVLNVASRNRGEAAVDADFLVRFLA